MNTTAQDASNVIAFRASTSNSKDEEVLNQDEFIYDPISDLLDEFKDLEQENSKDKHRSFIYHHETYFDDQISVEDDLMTISNSLIKKLKKMKQDLGRTKYYLSQLDIEDDI